ncbi:MAG: NADH-quinone oxidoreductase subunit C [Candidatus Ratteibacteria bacterium]
MEEDVKQSLIKQFNLPEETIRIPRPRRIFLEISQEKFKEVFDFSVKELKFAILLTITGLDEQERFGVIYHLARETGAILNIKTSIPRDNPTLKTITPDFSNADIYERELMDLFGIKVEGLPPGNRYPLSDHWPNDQYPLRKDWKQEGVTFEQPREKQDVSEKSGGDQNA